MRLLTSAAKSATVGVLGVLGLAFLTLGAALALGEWLGSYPGAFVLAGVFYFLLAGLAYMMRKRIDRWILRSFSDLYWKD
jgi:hypothetical protein